MDSNQEAAEERPTPNIVRGADGTYRWVYEFSMMRNPMILITLWKIFGITFLILNLFMLLLALFEGNVSEWAAAWFLTPQFLIIPGILLGLSIVGYFITAAMSGWTYIVLFEMNEEGIRHIQQEKQFTKAQGLMWLTAFAGALSGNLTTAGAGLLAATKSESRSRFSEVRKVKVLRAFHTIKVNELLEHNQVYAEPEDFDFVLQYILARVPEKARS